MAGAEQSPAMAEPASEADAEIVHAIKGFDRDLKCRGMQFEVGGTYTHNGDVVRCGAGGFHSVEGNPLDAWTYYGPATSRYCTVAASGKIARAKDGDSKISSALLYVEAEILLPVLIRRTAEWVISRAKGNTGTGYSGHAAATGDSGHAAATGNWGHAAATGDSGHAAATGYSGHAAATGNGGVAVSIGINGTATAGETGAIVLAHWVVEDEKWCRKIIAAFDVGTHGVEPGKTYRLNASGLPEEVTQ